MIQTVAYDDEGNEVVVVIQAARTGDLLAQQRGEASAAFRRKYKSWPTAFEQTVDGNIAYKEKA